MEIKPLYVFGCFAAFIIFKILWHFFGTAQRRRAFGNTYFNKAEKKVFTASPRYQAILAVMQPILDKAEKSRRKIIFWKRILFLIFWTVLIASQFVFDSVSLMPFIFCFLALFFIPRFIYSHVLTHEILPKAAEISGFELVKHGNGVTSELKEYETRISAPQGKPGGRKRSILFGEYDTVISPFGFKNALTAFDNVNYTVNKRDNEGKSTEETVFSGIILRVKMNQPFPCPILIREDLGAVGNKVLNDGYGMQRIGFEDTEFEKFFEAYAPDQIAARKALPPRFLEKIRNIMTAYNDAMVSALFFEDRLFVAINTPVYDFSSVKLSMKPESYEVLGRLIKSFEIQQEITDSLE